MLIPFFQTSVTEIAAESIDFVALNNRISQTPLTPHIFVGVFGLAYSYVGPVKRLSSNPASYAAISILFLNPDEIHAALTGRIRAVA